MKTQDLTEMCNADLMHYAREQRKFIYNNFEKYRREEPTISLTNYIQKVYIPCGLAEKFHKQYMASHRLAREYLATVTPQC